MRILFVCTGNTCRSPMAEVIFNKLCNIEGAFSVSAGLSIVPHSKMSKNAALVIQENYGMDLRDRNAVQLTQEIIDEADIILTMTEYIKEVLRKYFPGKKSSIYSLNGYLGIEGDIIDPYGGDKDVYDSTFSMLKDRIEMLIVRLQK